MLRFFASIALCSTMLGCGGVPKRSSPGPAIQLHAGTVVLRVEVIEDKYTGVYPESNCPEGKQCIQFSSWAKYRARVKEVISGHWRQDEVTFARLEHAPYVEEMTRDCYVILLPSSPDIQSKIGVPFVAKELLSNFKESHRETIRRLREGSEAGHVGAE